MQLARECPVPVLWLAKDGGPNPIKSIIQKKGLIGLFNCLKSAISKRMPIPVFWLAKDGGPNPINYTKERRRKELH